MLRETAQAVPPELFGTPELQSMLEEMIVALDAQADGVALAAPQVGIRYRIFIVRYDRMQDPEESEDVETGPQIGIYINPEFVKSSRKCVEVPEGCLSVRGLYGTTLRHERATITATDETGVRFTRGAGGILAQAFQHETDHLNGILFIDHATDIHEQQRPHAEDESELA